MSSSPPSSSSEAPPTPNDNGNDNNSPKEEKQRQRQQKVYTSTICIVPQPQFITTWKSLTKARTQLRDPGLYRWPPHVNLLYPFILPPSKKDENEENDKETKNDAFLTDTLTTLHQSMASIKPFRVQLSEFGCFGGKNRGVLWLYPHSSSSHPDDDNKNDDDDNDEEEPIKQLQKCLQDAFPICHEQRKQGTFSPHMTLSHYDSLNDATAAQQSIERWWDNESYFDVDRVYWLRRKGDDGQFLIAAEIYLNGGGYRDWHDDLKKIEGMPEEEEDWVRMERMALKRRRNDDNNGRRRRKGDRRRRRRKRDVVVNDGRDPRGRSKSRDSPEVIAAKRAERKAKRERMEEELARLEDEAKGLLLDDQTTLGDET